MTLTHPQATRFATAALGHVTREYPNHLAHTLQGPHDAATPQVLHPIFYGSYDWHSCVHAYWMLADLLARVPGLPQAEAITTLFDTHLTPENVAAETAYFHRPGARGFERPYGWAWLLKLAATLRHAPNPAWSQALAPLAQTIATRLSAHLAQSPYPVRVGTHFNTAFALRLAADYAEPPQADPALLPQLQSTARAWYANDQACQAWEPCADDFLSPALIEAECMRRLLPPAEFAPWFDAFLPGIATRTPKTLFTPPTVSDRSDGKTAHLDGLSLTRAWCWQSLAKTLPPTDPRQTPMHQSAQTHLQAALPHITGDYMGEHWLATFAVLALTA